MPEILQFETIAAALAKAQGEIKAPLKTRHVDYQPMRDGKPYGQRVKYSYADLADCIEAVRIPFAKNNLCVVHQIIQTDKFYDLKTTLMHSSGQSLDTIYPLPDPTSVKPQEFGSALTYARRYSFSTIVGIASEEDDDGQTAPTPPAKPSPPKPVVPPPKPPVRNYATDPLKPAEIKQKLDDIDKQFKKPELSTELSTDEKYNPETAFESQEPISAMDRIVILKERLGYSNDQMREVVQRVTGKASTKDCNENQLEALFDYLQLKL